MATKQGTKKTQRTNISTAAGAAMLTLNFKGLFIFCFNGSSECQAGVLSTAPGHQMYVEVLKKSKTGEQSEFSFTLSPMVSRLKDRIHLEINGATPGIASEFGTGAFDRMKQDADQRDLRWIADYESSELHGKVNLRPGVFKPVLHITNGTFYTAGVSPKQYLLVRGWNTVKDFGYMGRYIGTDINVAAGGEIKLRMERKGESDVVVSLGKVEADCTYEATIVNSRPGEFQPDDRDTDSKTTRNVGGYEPSDMQYYYHGIDKDSTEWYDFREKTENTILGLPPSECYNMLLGQTNNIP